MASKIITKPLTSEEIIDKSRHITGFNRWARSSRTIAFIMLLVEWLCIPFEVIFRRDFGQRWFTIMNFLAGFVVIVTPVLLQILWETLVKVIPSTVLIFFIGTNKPKRIIVLRVGRHLLSYAFIFTWGVIIFLK